MSQRARQRRRKGSGSRVVFGILGVIFAAGVLAVGAGAAYVVHWVGKAPPLSKLHPVVAGGNSEVFAANGSPLGYIRSDILRTAVSWKEIPSALKNATVAIEDQRFYEHGGVDLQGILRSAVKDVLSGQAIQGGSTIEMQLVRNLYMPASERTERTLKRKIIEAVEADRLEDRYSKQYILTHYLNTVPYGTVGGQNAIGVQAAARVFFNKTVSQLTLPQAALLAGLPQAPSEYNPFLFPAAATQRRNEVLTKMAQLHYISQAAADAAIASPLDVHPSTYYEEHRGSSSYFFDYITQELIDKYGLNTVREGGLRVYTTINLRMEHLAQQAIDNDLNEPGDPSSAIVTEDPRTGDVLAMAQTKSSSQFNLSVQGARQPGSTFKAIVLADALSRGVDPDTTYYYSHTIPVGQLPGWNVPVTTFEGVSLDRSINLVDATLTSDNTVYAQLAADLGEQSVTQMAYAMGVTTKLNSYPAEALGGLRVGVSPLEMANVYATLADGGERNKQISITRVTFPGGRVDRHWGVVHKTRVLSPAVAAEETTILHENVEEGTATRSAISCPTAAKTGTTSDLVDAWLDGYNPDFSTVVWMGYPTKRISMTDVHGESQQGGYLPAQIWHDYMLPVVRSNCAAFPTPAQPIQYVPFNGKYEDMFGLNFGAPVGTTAVTGASGATGPGGTKAPAAGNQTSPGTGAGTSGQSGTGTGNQNDNGAGTGQTGAGAPGGQTNTTPATTTPATTTPATTTPATTTPGTVAPSGGQLAPGDTSPPAAAAPNTTPQAPAAGSP